MGSAEYEKSVIATEDSFYTVNNHLASITNMYYKDGSNVELYMYTPFGGMLVYSAGGSEILESSIGNVRGFNGREWDSESGINYYRARYYDPAIGRFLSEDPLKLAAGDINYYRYVSNNSINLRDPYCKQSCQQKFNECYTNEMAKAVDCVINVLGPPVVTEIGIAVVCAGVCLAAGPAWPACFQLCLIAGSTATFSWAIYGVSKCTKQYNINFENK